MRHRLLPAVALVLLAAGTACDQRQAYGDPNAIVVGTPEARWTAVQEILREELQPTFFTVRDEETFRMTWKDPADADWPVLRQFRQVLLVGSPEDPWMADAMEVARRRGGNVTPPSLVQVFDVWARGQVVNLMLVPPEAGESTIRPLADSLQNILDDQYRQISLSRMYASGRNDSLTVQLERNRGFTLDLPRVYYWDVQDSVWLFRNDNPDPSQLIRQIAVTWISPIPDEELYSQEWMAAWRQELIDGYYQDRQVTDLQRAELSRGRLGEREIVQLQAGWTNPPDESWPVAGPVIMRAVECPGQDRLYLVDAWLYAPGQDKYQYMIQLETILNSFRCTDSIPTPEEVVAPGEVGSAG